MNKRKLLSLIIAFFTLVVFYFMPSPEGLTYAGKMMIATLLFGAILFISEALPLGISGLLVMVIPPVFGVLPPDEVFGFFGNEAVFFLIGAFILAAGIQSSGLHVRFAYHMLKFFGNSPKKMIFGILVLGATLSFVISEHAVVALLLPIVGLVLMQVPKGSNAGKAGMIALTYGCTAGSVATLMGGARNPYTVAFLYENYGVKITYAKWVIMAMPISLLMIPLLWVILTRLYPPEEQDVNLLNNLGPMGAKEWKMLLILIITIIMLFYLRDLGIAVAVIAGASLIFLLDIASWRDVEKSLPWGVVLLYGGAMTLGRGLQVTGASRWIAGMILGLIGHNPYLVLAVLIGITILMTEIMSHAAAVALMLPIGTGIAVLSGLNVSNVAMAIAISGGFGYALLLGTPGNILTYSTGYFKQRDIVKSGIIADMAGWVIVFLFSAFIWNAVGVV